MPTYYVTYWPDSASFDLARDVATLRQRRGST
jgi:hypothetical protein